MSATGRNVGLKRVLRLLKFFEGRRYRPSARDLALEFGVTYRTIYRDLALLEECHLHVPPPFPSRYYGAVGAEKSRYRA